MNTFRSVVVGNAIVIIEDMVDYRLDIVYAGISPKIQHLFFHWWVIVKKRTYIFNRLGQ